MTNDSYHPYTYDAEGNILTVDGGSNGQYVYDALNRRIRAQTSASTLEYMYDYAGRRTSSWLNPSSGNPGTGSEGRIYWGGQPIAYRAGDGTTYFEQQNYLGTERVRTNYTGAVASSFTSLAWGDGSSTWNNGTGANQDTYFFAGLDADVTATGAQMSDHAQFRNYSFVQGRWLAADPYDGSYDLTNPQSFNRYAYVLNNPLSFTDPLGLDDPIGCDPDDPSCSGCDPLWPDCGGPPQPIVPPIPRGGGRRGEGGPPGINPPLTGPNWGPDPGGLGETLGLPSNLPPGLWGIWGAFGLPDGCEFGACGGGTGFQQTYTPGSNSSTPPTLLQSLGQLLLGIDWTDPNGRLYGTHYCGSGGSGQYSTGNIALDRACYAHDSCYTNAHVSYGDNFSLLLSFTKATAIQRCNQILCNEASQLQGEGPKRVRQFFTYGGGLFYGCRKE